jgi:hypothetical protein
MQITTVGLDIAKNLFQVHGADAQGRVLLKRKLARGKVLEFFATLPACLVGLEACGAAHYRARELTRLGHQGRLMPPQYVRPYVKTNKHDAADAEACCEGGAAPRHAVCPAQGRGPASHAGAAPGARAAAEAAHRHDQRSAGPSGRVRDRRGPAPDRPARALGRGRRRGGPSPAAARPRAAGGPGRPLARPRAEDGGTRPPPAWSRPPAMAPLANVLPPCPGLDR